MGGTQEVCCRQHRKREPSATIHLHWSGAFNTERFLPRTMAMKFRPPSKCDSAIIDDMPKRQWIPCTNKMTTWPWQSRVVSGQRKHRANN